jgi:hypothetical protein
VTTKLEALRPLATRAATVFECLRTVAPHHASFDRCGLMVGAWLKQQKPLLKETRTRKPTQLDIPGLVDSLTLHLCRMATAALEGTDLPVFRFVLAALLVAETEQIDRADWRFLRELLLQHRRPPDNQVEKSANAVVVNDATIQAVATVEHAVSSFRGLSRDMELRIEVWTSHFHTAHVEVLSLPAPWNKKLNTFLRLLLWLVLRAARIDDCLDKFVRSVLGPELTSAKPLTIANIVDLTRADTAVVVSSRDPMLTAALLRLLATERAARWADTAALDRSAAGDEENTDDGEVWVMHQPGSPSMSAASCASGTENTSAPARRHWLINGVGGLDRNHHAPSAALQLYHEPQRDLAYTMAALLAAACDGSLVACTPFVVAIAFVHTMLLAKQHVITGQCDSQLIWTSTDFVKLVGDLSTFPSSSCQALQALAVSVYGASLAER